jgi:hypothetical protein
MRAHWGVAESMSAARAIGFAAVIMLAPGSAAAAVTTLQDLQFGPVPVGTVHTIDATNGLYAGAWVGAFDAGRAPCATGGTGRAQFPTLPLQLTSGANALNVTYGATSARVARQSDPNSFVEFNPNGGVVDFPISWFPVVLTLGGTATVDPAQVPGTYTGAIVPRIAYSRNIGGCNPFNQMNGTGTASLQVQPAMTVTALNGPIDLGQFFAGTSRIVAADGSSGTPAQFSVQGPPALSWRLTVTTVDLLHASLPDTVPLTFTGGLYGTVLPPVIAFASGDAVPLAAHGGGPLNVWLGYRADAGPASPPGIYTGSLTLTVEGLLN